MVPEMILSSKSFSTQVTRKWSFVRVCAFMDQEVIRLGEMTTAVLADKLFLCTENRKTQKLNYSSGVDAGFLEMGFIYTCIKVWGFALLILSHFSQISYENDIIWSH